ncbi:Zinc-binding alcohol dehydrogenase domain-containing protein cipB [Fusarium oxysporum f. sp. cubense]|uniref:Zinc-binding alcohol dehydrogenase domain-containing protein cipB n=1 Tax=Fusarium oxysporum f. sp. cubense TaxID=61366 RepID=A0A559LRD6_FUSOC|nr:Zinc-binding alcohol dehydrogenase domain-containing protein cipB [Fusarium oxysporum f. sp. cubense]
MAENKAAWIDSPSAYPLSIRRAPQPAHGSYLSHYPLILGEDAAGVVEDVGAGVTRFQKGDRVVAQTSQNRHCHGFMTKNPANSAFQYYPVAIDYLVSPIPDSITFEEAVVLPLAISTACAGGQNWEDDPDLGWSSVGATAIQLSVASGVNVIRTASFANHDLVKSLGADSVYDYKSPTAIEDIACALKKTNLIGVYDAISADSSFEAVSTILDILNIKVSVASVLPSNKEYRSVCSYLR